MADDVLNPFATVSIGFRGLAVYCYNKAFVDPDGREGRWEIAVPRFGDHELLLRIPNFGVLSIAREVKKIEIKDRVGVATKPTHEVDPFDRKNPDKSDPNDYRWLTDFTNAGDFPHGDVSIRKPDHRVIVTMVYVYDAIVYTKKIENFPLLRATQKNTCPVENGVPKPLPPEVAGAVLDELIDPYGFSATTVGIDIQSPRGGAIDLSLDGKITKTFEQANGLQSIDFSNLEPVNAPHDHSRVVQTQLFRYGRGDFFKYYELFDTTGPDRFHLWERSPLDVQLSRKGGAEPSSEGDCNGTRVNFGSLADLVG